MLQTGQGITVFLSLPVKCQAGTANSFWIIKLACWFQRRKFPQIVLQSVCRFRVIFERRLLLSRCPSNLCAGSAFSPAAGQLQVRSCTCKKANRKWTKINYGPLRKPHVDLALLLPVGLSSGQRCVNYFCHAMLPYFLLLPSVKVLANWSSLILLRVSRF